MCFGNSKEKQEGKISIHNVHDKVADAHILVAFLSLLRRQLMRLKNVVLDKN